MSSTIIQKTAHWFFIFIYSADPGILHAQSPQKKPMDHSVYDSWNRIQNAVISDDGAVPWYQGIELFVALRRLNKPVWMLVYNNEEHNLDKWPDRKDLSIRMMQFLDHYLKGAPVSVWMEQGVPAIEKGKNFGYI